MIVQARNHEYANCVHGFSEKSLLTKLKTNYQHVMKRFRNSFSKFNEQELTHCQT